MSSRGQAQKPVIQDEKEEDFYDCRETPDLREDEETQQEAPAFHTKTGTVLRLHQEEEKEKQGNRPEEEEKEKQGNSPEEEEEKQGDRPEEEEEKQGNRSEEEEKEKQGNSPEEEEEKQGNRPEEEEKEKQGNSPEEEEEKQGDRPEEEEENSDSDLKHDNSKGVEFDDDYLRELEKDLTQEEKASRRQQSLTMKEKGNDLFKAGDWLEAECCYTDALGLCPVCFSRERAVLFSNRAAARHHLDLKDQAISDCTRAIELDSEYLRALLRRAELYEQTDKLDEALEDYKQVLERDPNQASARQACMRLPQQIQERNEKLKEEMISKLKDLGNMFLRPFGLSTNNFQVNQDQETGSYSINFVQNPNNNR